MKKKIIKLTDIPETSYILLGISSHENDYRLSWALNKNAGTSFQRIDNYQIIEKKTHQKKDFAQYEFYDDEAYVRFLLLSNHSENGFLIPELKNMDFFIILIGETNQSYIQEFMKKVKNTDIISMVSLLDPSSLKSRTNLIFYQ